MQDPTIICPNCQTEIRLTESLAAPLVEAMRRGFEQRMRAKEEEVAGKEASFREREAALEAARQGLEEQVAARVKVERGRIAEEEARRAKVRLDAELQEQQDEIGNLKAALGDRDAKLAEARQEKAALDRARQELEDQKLELEESVKRQLREGRERIAADAEKRAKENLRDEMEERARDMAALRERVETQEAKLKQAQETEAEVLRQRRALEEEKREMALTIERRVQAEQQGIREKARREVEEETNLKLRERQETIEGLQKKIKELQQKSEQGSQQLQGEAQELDLEERLTAEFPTDKIVPVPKGELGGDILQSVFGPQGQPCGTILWESKRTKNWGGVWTQKLRDDQRAAKAEVAVIASQALPQGVDTFAEIDGVWVTRPDLVVPVAAVLRSSLIELARARESVTGQESKMAVVYEYLTGPHFKQRVQAIVEAFSTMQDDLAKEKKAIQKQWAKRETQLSRVLMATAGMYGDLQGLAGPKLGELEGLSLEESDEDDV